MIWQVIFGVLGILAIDFAIFCAMKFVTDEVEKRFRA
jgi:hypothetical protein